MSSIQRGKRSKYPGTKKRGSTWSYYLTLDGRKVWRGSYATQKEAADARAAAQVEHKQGRFRHLSKATVGEYLAEAFLPAKQMAGVKPSTLESYRQKVAVIQALPMGAMKVQAVRPTDVERMQQQLLQQGKAPRTISYTTTVLSMALDHALNVSGLIADNPAKRVKKPKPVRRTASLLTVDQMRQMLEATKDTEWEAFYRLALFTGARRGELLALRWSDVDWDAGTVTIRSNLVEVAGKPVETTPKNGEARVVTLDTATVLVLRAHRKNQAQARLEVGPYWKGDADSRVTVKGDGSDVAPKSASQHWARLRRRLGVPSQVRLHDSRHTHATLLLEAGEPLHVVADRLGHKDASVTSTVYAHVLRGQQDQAAARFAEAVGLD